MKEIELNNPEVKEILNGFLDWFKSIDTNLIKLNGKPDTDEYYTSEEYFELVNKPDHVGFPEEGYGFQVSKGAKERPDIFEPLKLWTKNELVRIFGANNNSLTSYYPPKGFVGWHTNYDATAYQVLFTWSKTGNGYFKYYDKEKDEIVTIQDVPGWQCRHYYFGPEDEPHNHCWHSAYAGDERITLAYKFVGHGENDPRDAQARHLRDMLIEEIESE